ncbi:LOW QUALITY PROTEIN: rho guanine nucleotide exchange factor 11 [Polyodon spathula]|uniref:LOW QUALITY PROTEIN: rho guanine nucleotide exchange factor 11 n=1 Tax=Polyodon spathula TaxID=7913 RepID=UPI001B7E3C0F|nr:LOW QUALITY PROTEIN: rho guanine nucleotide exchange factor 11 [Polyodon spathula]
MNLRTPASALDRSASKRQPHLPSPLAAWLSSLSMGDSIPDRRNSANHQKESWLDCSTENTGLVHRCVIVQKDQQGFGFTVCGDRIVLVQHVRPGGAAMKAGLHEGDRIIKVNGSLVSSLTHQEVVRLIKSGHYVALTLQGPPHSTASLPLLTDASSNLRSGPGGLAPPPPPPPLPPNSAGLSASDRITGPRPLQDSEVQKHGSQILRKMLKQEEAELQELLEERSRNPSPSLEERIESARRRAKQVRVKIQQDVENSRSRSESSAGYLRAGEARLSMDSQDADSELFLSESPRSSPLLPVRTSHHRRHGSDAAFTSEQVSRPQIIGPEEEEDDEESYLQNEMDGPFQDIDRLKSRPAHMAVFMRYIFGQLLDPNPLLFYLSVEAYLCSSQKDARSLALQISAHFLEKDAPLKIRVPEDINTEIESRIQSQEDIRGPLSDLQHLVLPEIQDQIQDYRSKQMMGLGSLFGEGDLQQLDGDPSREKQIVDKQATALWEILSKHEEDRSSPMAAAVLLYLRHAGIKLRDSRVFNLLEKPQEREKWLPFFPKTKKPSSAKKDKEKERDSGEDKKRNPILKYIAKPKGGSSQSTFHVPLSLVEEVHASSSSTEVLPGSVRNMILQFENNHEYDSPDPNTQRLSTGSLTEPLLDSDRAAGSVKLARSESLKTQGELRKPRVEAVPRSRSDVDMEGAAEEREREGEGPRLHQSASSSASSLSARSVENQTPPYTPKLRRRSMDSPNSMYPENLLPNQSEDDPESQNWQETVGRDVLSTLEPREIDRQAVIYELFTTELSHLRTLRVLDQVFYQKMKTVLNSEELNCIFPNLPAVIDLHASLCDSMKRLRDSSFVNAIGDIMLARFEGLAGEGFQEVVSQFCSHQAQALELIKNKQRKEPRFQQLIQECEANPQCRRLQLKDLLVSEMQRLTKYPLLLGNIIKYTDSLNPDLPLLKCAQHCCRGILKLVNQAVKETENRHRLDQYQRKLDLTPLERTTNPVAAQFKNLDLTTKRMIHEGPLTWRVSKDKTIELQALLLEDLLVLLQRVDDRLVLRCPTKTLGGGSDLKMFFSPIVRLDSVLVRWWTDKKALFIISTSERQIYELVAGTSSEKNTWKDLLEEAVSLATQSQAPANHRPAAVSSSSLDLEPESSGTAGSADYNSEPLVEPSVSMETETLEDTDVVTTPTPPVDQSEGSIDDVTEHGSESAAPSFAGGIADAALQDVENLRKLIFKNVRCGRCDGSLDTATEIPGETRSSPPIPTRGRDQEARNHAPNPRGKQSAPRGTEAPPLKDPSFRVVRKAEGAGTSTFTDDVTLDSSQSGGCSQTDELKGGGVGRDGNTFYLAVTTGPVESSTDEPSACNVPAGRDDAQVGRGGGEDAREARPSQWEHGTESHVVRNVDAIFVTIENLTVKLHKLREIEAAHYHLLKTLARGPVSQGGASPDQTSAQHPTAAVRTRAFDRGAGDGKEGNPTDLVQPETRSTGF